MLQISCEGQKFLFHCFFPSACREVQYYRPVNAARETSRSVKGGEFIEQLTAFTLSIM
jgi:hypothetical protein